MDPTVWSELAGQIFAPRRARLVDVLQTLTGAARDACEDAALHSDPFRRLMARAVGPERLRWSGHIDAREAWESVAPPAWLEEPRRRFATLEPFGDINPCPATLGDVLSFASDPDGMRAAEELAGEFLEGAGLPAAQGVVWCTVVPRRWRAALGRDGAPWDALTETGTPARVREAEEAARVVRAGAVQRVGGCAWDAAAVARAELLARDARATRTLGALRGIWSLGYALDRVTEAGCVLVAARV